MKVLVTGGSGLVGRSVVDLLSRHHDVHVLDVKTPHRKDLPHIDVDVMEAEKVAAALRGFEAVVHLAGIPHPLGSPADTVFRINTVGTLNVLEGCVRSAVRRLVFLSSESTLGFAFCTHRMWPAYLPIDEAHPVRPQDPYGLSKLSGEMLCAGFSRRTDIKTYCLRAPWIWVPEPREIALYRGLVREWEKWWKNLWAFVHVLDVAEAIQKLLIADLSASHEVYFISARENWTGIKSRELAASYFPETKEIRKEFTGTSSFLSSAKARAAFGFEARYGVRDVLSSA